MRTRGIALSCFLLLLLAPPARAELHYEWGHPKPQGNAIFGLAFRDASNGWAVGGGGLVLRTQDGASTWHLLGGLTESGSDLNDVFVLNSGTLLVAGQGARIFRSTDDGDTWSPVGNPASGDLRDLAEFPGGVSAAGENGTVIVSTDDGQSWTEQGPGTGVIRHHVWRSVTEGYAVGENVSHRTIDGGTTWTQFIPTGAFGYNEVYFTGATHGVVVEDFGTWQTTDGGANWTELPQFGEPLYRYRTLVLDAQHWVSVTLFEGAEFWETTDGGATWTQFVDRRSTGFVSVAQLPSGRIVMGSDVGDLLHTDDLGRTLENATINLCEAALNAPITDIVGRPDGTLFAANQPSASTLTESWLRSDDGGHSWYAPAQTPGLRWIDAKVFHDDLHGLVTYRYFVRATSDGGSTWQSGDLATNRRAWDVAMPTATRAFLTTAINGGGGDLMRSDDGGLTWALVQGGLPAPGVFEAGTIDFTSTQHGVVSGRVGGSIRLYRTDDGGDTWTQVVPVGLPGSPGDMHWFDANVGLAGVSSGQQPGIYRTANGGAQWTQVSDVRANQLAFRDAQHGAAVGPNHDFALTTSDGGQSWSEVRPPLYGPAPGAQFAYVNAVWPTDEGWVFGASNNRILVGVDPALVTAAPARPSRGALRVHPSPFNPRTTVELVPPVDGPAEVAVYDTRGRRVRVLHVGLLVAGQARDWTWDGRDEANRAVASGVYFLKAKGPGYEVRGKAVLVR